MIFVANVGYPLVWQLRILLVECEFSKYCKCICCLVRDDFNTTIEGPLPGSCVMVCCSDSLSYM